MKQQRIVEIGRVDRLEQLVNVVYEIETFVVGDQLIGHVGLHHIRLTYLGQKS